MYRILIIRHLFQCFIDFNFKNSFCWIKPWTTIVWGEYDVPVIVRIPPNNLLSNILFISFLISNYIKNTWMHVYKCFTVYRHFNFIPSCAVVPGKEFLPHYNGNSILPRVRIMRNLQEKICVHLPSIINFYIDNAF